MKLSTNPNKGIVIREAPLTGFPRFEVTYVQPYFPRHDSRMVIRDNETTVNVNGKDEPVHNHFIVCTAKRAHVCLVSGATIERGERCLRSVTRPEERKTKKNETCRYVRLSLLPVALQWLSKRKPAHLKKYEVATVEELYAIEDRSLISRKAQRALARKGCILTDEQLLRWARRKLPRRVVFPLGTFYSMAVTVQEVSGGLYRASTYELIERITRPEGAYPYMCIKEYEHRINDAPSEAEALAGLRKKYPNLF